MGVVCGEVRIEEDTLGRLKLMCANELEVFFLFFPFQQLPLVLPPLLTLRVQSAAASVTRLPC